MDNNVQDFLSSIRNFCAHIVLYRTFIYCAYTTQLLCDGVHIKVITDFLN